MDKYIKKLNRYYQRKEFFKKLKVIAVIASLVAYLLFVIIFVIKIKNFS